MTTLVLLLAVGLVGLIAAGVGAAIESFPKVALGVRPVIVHPVEYYQFFSAYLHRLGQNLIVGDSKASKIVARLFLLFVISEKEVVGDLRTIVQPS